LTSGSVLLESGTVPFGILSSSISTAPAGTLSSGTTTTGDEGCADGEGDVDGDGWIPPAGTVGSTITTSPGIVDGVGAGLTVPGVGDVPLSGVGEVPSVGVVDDIGDDDGNGDVDVVGVGDADGVGVVTTFLLFGTVRTTFAPGLRATSRFWPSRSYPSGAAISVKI